MATYAEKRWFKDCPNPGCPVGYYPVEMQECPVCEAQRPTGYLEMAKEVDLTPLQELERTVKPYTERERKPADSAVEPAE